MRRCCLKDYLLCALATLLMDGAEPFTHFERGHHVEHSCEVICNLDLWFGKRCRLKTFLSRALAAPFAQWTSTICAILEKSVMRNNPVTLF